MNRKLLLRLLPIPALAAAAAAVLLVWQPWDGGHSTRREAAAETIEYRLCDTVVDGPAIDRRPAGLDKDYVTVSRSLEQPQGSDSWPVDWQPVMEIRLRLPSSGEPSSVSIDPTTAQIVEERYSSAEHRALLEPVVGTLRREPLDPATAPWPYSDNSETPLVFRHRGAFGSRPPDPGSGIVTAFLRGHGPDLSTSEVLIAANCRSIMEIGVTSRIGQPNEVTVRKDIHPDDEAAFQTLADTIVRLDLDSAREPVTLDPSGERGSP